MTLATISTSSRKASAVSAGRRRTQKRLLAQLGDQDTFGEDALISGEPRNVSVTALSDVSLLRLSKELFLTLIKQPTLKYIDYREAQDLVAKGADLIDVREPDRYKPSHLPMSINIPFFAKDAFEDLESPTSDRGGLPERQDERGGGIHLDAA